ncbi:hypothetical protein CABS01_07887 [Colletotrichum abscissum]|uniref:uncharacterized protein n=1 Tax=Colletotrichum abscissum TaxID=1671311 RepID=UPI0027D55C34|nr:uncharacterized protein CABS01_07887 [Colletotrichum abscissum]KAK1510215.1 hypothetical protein CABS01_07887 [Colletotrichum abscissum]
MNLSRPQPVERVPRRRNNIAIVVAGRQPRSDSQLSYEQVNYRKSSPANRECNFSVSRVQVGILRRLDTEGGLLRPQGPFGRRHRGGLRRRCLAFSRNCCLQRALRRG